VLITPVALHLVNASAVVGMKLAESAGAPLSAGEDRDAGESAVPARARDWAPDADAPDLRAA